VRTTEINNPQWPYRHPWLFTLIFFVGFMALTVLISWILHQPLTGLFIKQPAVNALYMTLVITLSVLLPLPKWSTNERFLLYSAIFWVIILIDAYALEGNRFYWSGFGTLALISLLPGFVASFVVGNHMQRRLAKEKAASQQPDDPKKETHSK
jgi:hypothetical protein